MNRSRVSSPQPVRWDQEVRTGVRFAFGENWARYLRHLDEGRIRIAEDSLKTMLQTETLAGVRLLDVGSGSGLFSLAARRLGAEVTSFDYDPQSVACTAELRDRFFPRDPEWNVVAGSILDHSFVSSLGLYGVVYSWGVLHHTGNMWRAMENALSAVAPGGLLFIAIYNDQEGKSRRWRRLKRAYVAAPRQLKWAVLLPIMARLWGPTIIVDGIRGHPLRFWKSYGKDKGSRGMHRWRDLIDWAGGYPFEVAKPEQIFDFCRERGFELLKLKTCGAGHGCNEFVFQRTAE